MNPLLGVGVVAAAAAVLAGANALANRDNVSTGNLGIPEGLVTDYGAYIPPEFNIAPMPGGGGSNFTNPPGSGGGGGGGTEPPIGAGSAAELQKRLEAILKEINELTYRMATGGITPEQAQKEIDKLREEMRVLTQQAQNQPQTVINLTVNGAMDKEGTARTIVETLNNSYYRGGGGGANTLVMP